MWYAEDQENRSFQLFEGMTANKLEDVPENFELTKQVTEPSESLEPEMTKKSGKCNLRKSLAWDRAFFTSAGTLVCRFYCQKVFSQCDSGYFHLAHSNS